MRKEALLEIYNDAHWFIDNGDKIYGASVLKWLYEFNERLTKTGFDGLDTEGIQKTMAKLKQEIEEL